MKRLCLIIFIMILMCGCTKKNENQLVMVTEAGFAPYEYYENGEVVGVDVDIAKEIAKYLGKKLVVKDIAFDSIINEVKTGKADFGAAGISYSDDRAKNVDFSINYAVSKQVVIVNNNSSITNVNGISNKKIAVQLGSIADTFVTEKYKNANVVRQKKYLAAIEDLKTGKVDGALTNDSYGMVVKKGNKELLDAINMVLQNLKDEGKIDEFIIKHTEK